MPWPYIVLTGSLIVGACYDMSRLLRSPVAVGVDGYYYVLQATELNTQGRLYYPSGTPFTLYLVGGLNYLLGNPIFSVKVSAVVLHALLAAGVAAIVITATRSMWLGIFGCLTAMVSGLHLYLISEFLNNLGAIAIGLWGVWCIIKGYQSRKVIWLCIAVLCFVASVFSHRSALPLGILIVVLIGLIYCLTLPGWKFRGAALALLVALWSAPLLIAKQTVIDVPHWLRGELVSIPRWSAATIAIDEKLVLLIIAPAVLVLTFKSRRRFTTRIPLYVFAATALWSLLLTLNPFLRSDDNLLSVAVRLSCLAYIQVAILLPALVWLVLPLSRRIALYILAFAFPLMVMSSRTVPFGMRSDYLRNREQLVHYLASSRQQLGPAPIIIATHGDQFIITAMLKAPSQQRWPRTGSYQTIYWLLQHVESRTFASYPGALEDDHRRFRVIIKDDDLNRELSTLSVEDRHSLLRNNPHLKAHVVLSSN